MAAEDPLVLMPRGVSRQPKLFDAAPFHRVIGLKFGLLPDDEASRNAVFEVHDFSKGTNNPTPPFSVLDPRFGPATTRDLPCATCNQRLRCPGHLARIVLPFPVYHCSFIREVVQDLPTICFFCSRCVFLEPKDPRDNALLQLHERMQATAAARDASAKAAALAAAQREKRRRGEPAKKRRKRGVKAKGAASAVAAAAPASRRRHRAGDGSDDAQQAAFESLCKDVAAAVAIMHKNSLAMRHLDIAFPPGGDYQQQRRTRIQAMGASLVRRRCPWCAEAQPRRYTQQTMQLRITTTWLPKDLESAQAAVEATTKRRANLRRSLTMRRRQAAAAGAPASAAEVADAVAEELRRAEKERLIAVERWREINAPFHQARARSMLQSVPAAHRRVMGMPDHPEAMVPCVMPVIPVARRRVVLCRATARTDLHHLSGRYTVINRTADALHAWARTATRDGREQNQLERQANVWTGQSTAGSGSSRAARTSGGDADVASQAQTQLFTAAMADGSTSVRTLGTEAMDLLFDPKHLGPNGPLLNSPLAKFEMIQNLHAQTVDNSGQRAPRGISHCGNFFTSLSCSLKGKPGLVRNTMVSKRVDHSGRAVISGDISLAPCQVGMPAVMTDALTMPERVTTRNLARLQRALLLGPRRQGGAAILERAVGERIELAHSAPTPEARLVLAGRLAIGDVLHRHLVDGDVVLINRQPTLHKHGIMGARVRRMGGHTLRINLIITSPFNADFDGDEMTVHVPQTLEARAEVLVLCSIAANLASPSSSTPCMGAVQDTLTAAFAASSLDARLHRAAMLRALAPVRTGVGMDALDGEGAVGLEPLRGLPAPAVRVRAADGTWACQWTGKQLLSVILRRYGVTYVRGMPSPGRSVLDAVDGGRCVMIQDGTLLAGQLGKRDLGDCKARNLVHLVALHRGSGAALRMLFEIQQAVQVWAAEQGITLNLKDMSTTAAVRAGIVEDVDALEAAISRVQRAGARAGNSTDAQHAAETRLIQVTSGGIMKRIEEVTVGDQAVPHPYFGLREILVSGAKGSIANLQQMVAAAGQQYVSDERLRHAPPSFGDVAPDGGGGGGRRGHPPAPGRRGRRGGRGGLGGGCEGVGVPVADDAAGAQV